MMQTSWTCSQAMGDEEEEQLKKKSVRTLQFELEIIDKSVLQFELFNCKERNTFRQYNIIWCTTKSKQMLMGW